MTRDRAAFAFGVLALALAGLGLWNSFTNAGALIGPALVAVAGAATVVTASFATGWLSLAGAGWAAWWLPRFLPGRAKISRRSGRPSASA